MSDALARRIKLKSRKECVIRDHKLRGEEHVNHVGRYVDAKTIGPDCNCKRLKCFTAVSLANREKLFKHFYEIRSKDLQDSYLAGLICVEEIKQRRRRRPYKREESQQPFDKESITATAPDSSSESDICKFSHTASVFYKVRVRNDKGVLNDVPVCRAAFMSIHGITPARVRRLYNSLMTTGYIPVDTRGKHKNRPGVFPPEVKELIRCHILSFEPRPLLKDSPHRKFLSDELSIRKLFRLFLNEYQIQIAYRDYWNIFKTDFNIKFGVPGAKRQKQKQKRAKITNTTSKRINGPTETAAKANAADMPMTINIHSNNNRNDNNNSNDTNSNISLSNNNNINNTNRNKANFNSFDATAAVNDEMNDQNAYQEALFYQ